MDAWKSCVARVGRKERVGKEGVVRWKRKGGGEGMEQYLWDRRCKGKLFGNMLGREEEESFMGG